MKAPRNILDHVSIELVTAKAEELTGRAICDLKTGCWSCSCYQKRGYGWVSIGGRSWFAHRVVWTAKNGEPPPDKWLLHKCDNRSCINPDHLYMGTPRQNNLDVLTRNRRTSKLSYEIAATIRSLYATGKYAQQELGNMFGVTQTAIGHVVLGKQWRAQ